MAEQRESASLVLGGILTWRLLYNQKPDLLPATTTTMAPNVAVEADIERVKADNPNFFDFLKKVEVFDTNPGFFRFGAMMVYRLKTSAPESAGKLH